MQALLINFNLEGLDRDQFHALGSELAPAFAAIDGLVAKIWIGDDESNTYGALYLFDDARSREVFLASDLAEAVRTHPNLANVTARPFDVFDDLTAKTQPGATIAAAAVV
ncbi:MAG TPA: YdhR family protein [Gaiellaceae bacterium]|nr:YdhR family protein [Gaiellaceae bacterium]